MAKMMARISRQTADQALSLSASDWLHLHSVDQAGPGEVDNDAVDRTVLVFGEDIFLFKEDSRDDDE